MRIEKVSDFVNILSNNKNFKVTLNILVLTLLSLKLFMLFGGSCDCVFNGISVTTKMCKTVCIDVWEASCFVVVKMYFDTSYN